MALDINDILNIVVSHAQASGSFDRVNQHEPKNPVGNGVTCAIWVDYISPVITSGLSSTSARLLLKVRIYKNMLSEPQDAIDPDITAAVDTQMTAYNGDFTLGGEARNIDIMGQYGVPLQAQAGYLNLGNTIYRVMEITIPIIVNDVWDQAE